MKYTDAEFLARAREAYQVDGEVEFDAPVRVSRTHPDVVAAYVRAWVWVEFPEEEEPLTGPCQHGSESCTYPNTMESYNWCDQHRAANGRN